VFVTLYEDKSVRHWVAEQRALGPTDVVEPNSSPVKVKHRSSARIARVCTADRNAPETAAREFSTGKGIVSMGRIAQTAADTGQACTLRRTAGLLCAVVWVALFASSRPVFCDERDEELLDPKAFLPQYRNAVHRLRTIYQNVRMDGIRRVVPARPEAAKAKSSQRAPARKVTAGTPTKERLNDFSYASCDGREKLVRSVKGTGSESVIIYAGGSQFSLTRSGASLPYKLGFQTSDPEKEGMRAIAELRQDARDAAYRLAGFDDYEDVIKSPYFSIERAARVAGPSGSFIRLRVRYNPPADDAPHFDGRLDLDEALGLVIREFDYRSWRKRPNGKIESAVTWSVQYKQVNGNAIPTHVAYTLHNITGGRVRGMEYDISRYALERTPSEEFTLAYYGLGDYAHTLAQVEKRSAYRTSAIGAGAVLIGFVLFAIGRKAHKARARNKPSGAAPEPSGSSPLEHAT
jgi:hypothetical protein